MLLTATGERLARRPLTELTYVGEARLSPLSVKTVLCEISEDEEQNSEGTVGLVGDATKASDSDTQRRSGGASGTEICGDADKSGGEGRGLEGAGCGLGMERGLGGNRGEGGVVDESSNPREGNAGRGEEDAERTCDSLVICDCCSKGLSEGESKVGVNSDDCFSASPTISVCGFPTGKFSSERVESITECGASPVNSSELGDVREAGRDGRTSCSSLDPAGEAARIDGTGE